MIQSLENSEDIYLEADVCFSNKYPSYIFTFLPDHLNDGVLLIHMQTLEG